MHYVVAVRIENIETITENNLLLQLSVFITIFILLSTTHYNQGYNRLSLSLFSPLFSPYFQAFKFIINFDAERNVLPYFVKITRKCKVFLYCFSYLLK